MQSAELYTVQNARWPTSGRHILARYDDKSIIVYQAYNHSIASHAIKNQTFGGPDWSMTRLTWIKTNFCWMMYRSGWATKRNQEYILAIKITRSGFEEILGEAVPTSFEQGRGVNGEVLWRTEQEWRKALHKTNVQLQWDPDHGLSGGKKMRRAIQLGLRGEMMRRYLNEFIIEIEDVTSFVKGQYELIKMGKMDEVLTPIEEIYEVSSELKGRIGLPADEERTSSDGHEKSWTFDEMLYLFVWKILEYFIA